jgi:hypothetical protein
MAVDKFVKIGNKFVIDKDPQAVLDYAVDFAKMLEPVSDVITGASVSTTGGLVLDSLVFDDYKVTAWLSGGDLTVGSDYASATFHIETANSPQRIDERTVFFKVLQR